MHSALGLMRNQLRSYELILVSRSMRSLSGPDYLMRGRQQLRKASFFASLDHQGILQPLQYLLERQYNRAWAIQMFLKYIGDNFLMKMIKEPVKAGALWDLTLTKKERTG